MRKLIVSEFITLDGVIQAPGGSTKIETMGSRTAGGAPMRRNHEAQ